MNDGMRPISTDTGLAAQAIELAYGNTPVFADMSIDVAPNRFTVLLGPNGSGKSTLLCALARLHRPARGYILLNGSDIFRHPTKEVAKKLGMLAQQNHTPEGLSVFDLVSRGRYPHQGFLKQWSEEDARAVEEALSVTGMSELAERAVDSLSGGQRQRAWIAMVLAQETPILLLDEPTTFLDMAHQADLLDLLQQLNTDMGRTVIAVLHDLNQACRYATHIIAMCEGTVVAEGRPADVVTEEMLEKVFDLPCMIIEDPITATPHVIPRNRRRPVNGTDAT